MESSERKSYRVTADHVVTDDQGRQFGPGDVVDVLPASDHNDELVKSGALTALDDDAAKPAKRRTKNAESEDADK